MVQMFDAEASREHLTDIFEFLRTVIDGGQTLSPTEINKLFSSEIAFIAVFDFSEIVLFKLDRHMDHSQGLHWVGKLL